MSMRLRIPPRFDWLFLAGGIAAAIALVLLLGCGEKRPAAPIAPEASRAPSALDASASGSSAVPLTELEQARADRDAAAARVVSLEARDRQREQDAQRKIAAQQSRWASWIAGVIAFGAVAYMVAAVVWGLPKSIGAIAGGTAAALLIGARLWLWLAEHALAAGLAVLALGALVGLWLLIRERLAAKTIAEAAAAFERAETDAEIAAAKVAAFAAATDRRVVGLVARIRGKPVKPDPGVA